MAKARPSVQKRLKEARMLEKKQAKAARKAAREAAREEGQVEVEEGVDPDLIGIKAGPNQARPWLDDYDAEED